ncbi:MAG: hypothetical protein H0X35_07080 [Pseudonocardiales bacterium]|nr:hypothetical protein [Pseudonocardiales bacterium]
MLSAGAALFARYADAPNALGYCGPPEGIGTADAEIRASARRFSGVWPYLQVLARLTDTSDPLDARLVEAYWLGRDLGVDQTEFGRELLAVLGPRAGAYWTHLNTDLLAEAAPDHGFHVFGVYPWSRLLSAGPQPLEVLDSCRIRWGTVVGLDPLTVSSPRLTWDGAQLGMAEPTVGLVTGNGGGGGIAVGDRVAVHWDRLVDVLTPDQVEVLVASTAHRLAVTTARLGVAAG